MLTARTGIASLTVALLLLLPGSAPADWDFSKSIIPTDEILSGGPPKDGIPALSNPEYVPAAEAGYMRDDEEVIGFTLEGESRAYPLRILSWHELVNDRIGGKPVLVSW
jgi:hypothetical protein